VAIAYLAGSWLLVEVSETLFPIYGLSDDTIRLVITLLAIGFPIVLVISWVFELTPQGLKLEKNIDRSVSVTHLTGKQLDRIIIVLLTLALGYFAFDKFVLSGWREATVVEAARQEGRSTALVESYGNKSIAVLPFVNMSADQTQEYFSDGISEELINLLAKTPGLRVISRSSAFSFKGKDVTSPAVAAQLNVAHILEGSVRKDGDRVRITAQLIEARSDSHLWSESYDRELHDIFAVQEEIAAAIGAVLKVKLALVDEEEQRPTVIRTANIEAYEAYLRGRELVHLRGRENLEAAVRELELSLRLNEEFAPAHAQLAIATTLMVDDLNSYGPLSLEEVKRRAIPHLDRAQELEPDLAEVYGGRALLAIGTGDLESAIEYARKALVLNPSDLDAMSWSYLALGAVGRYGEADATLKHILELDPLSIIGRINYIGWLCDRGRVQEAHDMADLLLAQSPEFGYVAHADTSLIYEGRVAEGLAWALQAQAGDFYVINAFILVGEYEEARRIDEVQAYWVDLAEQQFDKAIRTVRKNMSLDPENQEAILATADVLYLADRLDEALPLYEQLFESAPEGRPISQPAPDIRTMRLALARRRAGDEDGAQMVAEIVRQDLVARHTAGQKNQEKNEAEAMLAAFENNTEGVIVALESAIQLGLRNIRVFDDPAFEGMSNEPRFILLKQELEQVLTAEHDKVLQLICFSNPAPGNWQPLPETCEGVGKLLRKKES
jgi:TolB-like protein/Flp pilus assembly protein TadD